MLGKRSEELIIRLRVVGNSVELVNIDDMLPNQDDDRTARVPIESTKALKNSTVPLYLGDRPKPKEDRPPRQPPNIAPEDASRPKSPQVP